MIILVLLFLRVVTVTWMAQSREYLWLRFGRSPVPTRMILVRRLTGGKVVGAAIRLLVCLHSDDYLNRACLVFGTIFCPSRFLTPIVRTQPVLSSPICLFCSGSSDPTEDNSEVVRQTLLCSHIRPSRLVVIRHWISVCRFRVGRPPVRPEVGMPLKLVNKPPSYRSDVRKMSRDRQNRPTMSLERRPSRALAYIHGRCSKCLRRLL